MLKRVFGIPDIVIHNIGGTLNITDPLCSMADWRKVSRFNLEIPVELNTLIIPDMQKKKWGTYCSYILNCFIRKSRSGNLLHSKSWFNSLCTLYGSNLQ